jgi:hypothetical protein
MFASLDPKFLGFFVLCGFLGMTSANIFYTQNIAYGKSNLNIFMHPCEEDECEGGYMCVSNSGENTACEVYPGNQNCKTKACGHKNFITE